MSVFRKRLSTALPKEPVPPVIKSVLLVKRDIVSYSPLFSVFCEGKPHVLVVLFIMELDY